MERKIDIFLRELMDLTPKHEKVLNILLYIAEKNNITYEEIIGSFWDNINEIETDASPSDILIYTIQEILDENGIMEDITQLGNPEYYIKQILQDNKYIIDEMSENYIKSIETLLKKGLKRKDREVLKKIYKQHIKTLLKSIYTKETGIYTLD